MPALSGYLGARAGRRQAGARGELSAELVELLGAAPEIVAFGGEAAALARIRDADAALVKLARRDAFATGTGDALGLVVTGITVAGVLARRDRARRPQGSSTAVLIAMLALLALASFEAVTPLAAAARELLGHARFRPPAARADHPRGGGARPGRRPPRRRHGRSRSRSTTCAPAIRTSRDPALDGVSLRLAPG